MTNSGSFLCLPVVGGIELYLVVLHPNQRAFVVRRRPNPAFFGKCRSRGYGPGRGEQYAP
jgi:hypothetical protein